MARSKSGRARRSPIPSTWASKRVERAWMGLRGGLPGGWSERNSSFQGWILLALSLPEKRVQFATQATLKKWWHSLDSFWRAWYRAGPRDQCDMAAWAVSSSLFALRSLPRLCGPKWSEEEQEEGRRKGTWWKEPDKNGLGQALHTLHVITPYVTYPAPALENCDF